MREIKFRAWDTFQKRMVVDAAKVGGRIYWDNGDSFSVLTKDFVLLQWTGLDSIYAGDIVIVSGCDYYSNESFNTEDGESWTFTGEVAMNSFMWMVIDKGSGSYVPFCDLLNGELDIEVIGNIYENSDLLQSGR